MEMKEHKKGDVLIVDLIGELMGGDEAKPFQDRIYEAIRQGEVKLVVNLEAIKWMNSSGLGLLMAGLTTLRSSDGDLKLANVSDRVRRPIEVTKLDSVLIMFNSLDEAVQSYAEGG